MFRNWFVNTGKYETDTYNGVTSHAHPGLHEELASLVLDYIPRGASVLDVGAGAGAFSQRLADLGYNVTALDVDPSRFRSAAIPFRVLDINRGLVAGIQGHFDAACCVEVIEHVENPWALLRDIAAVLNPGGIALISTPHVTNFLSRLSFLRTGQLYSFGPESLDMGHINPVHPFEMREIIRRLGWKTLEEKAVGYLPVMDFGNGMTLRRAPFKIVANLARFVVYLLSSGENKRGWCLAFVLEKPI